MVFKDIIRLRGPIEARKPFNIVVLKEIAVSIKAKCRTQYFAPVDARILIAIVHSDVHFISRSLMQKTSLKKTTKSSCVSKRLQRVKVISLNNHPKFFVFNKQNLGAYSKILSDDSPVLYRWNMQS